MCDLDGSLERSAKHWDHGGLSPAVRLVRGEPRTCPVTAGFSSSYFCSDGLEDRLDVGPVERGSTVQPTREGRALGSVLKGTALRVMDVLSFPEKPQSPLLTGVDSTPRVWALERRP